MSAEVTGVKGILAGPSGSLHLGKILQLTDWLLAREVREI